MAKNNYRTAIRTTARITIRTRARTAAATAARIKVRTAARTAISAKARLSDISQAQGRPVDYGTAFYILHILIVTNRDR